MKRVEFYTLDDLKEELEKGASDTEVAVKKWGSIVEALKVIEEVSVQLTSYCLKYQEFGCRGCPITKYDYPCGHPYAIFTMFYQELRKLRIMAESLYAILLTIDREDKESKRHYV
ncbi:MAG: hypothetical protein DRO98_06700 [Archaeoglobales archaeon]|nr:MAG: hypothetical protein DRO98_06700 [Archaeoglobales archaeon]